AQPGGEAGAGRSRGPSPARTGKRPSSFRERTCSGAGWPAGPAAGLLNPASRVSCSRMLLEFGVHADPVALLDPGRERLPTHDGVDPDPPAQPEAEPGPDPADAVLAVGRPLLLDETLHQSTVPGTVGAPGVEIDGESVRQRLEQRRAVLVVGGQVRAVHESRAPEHGAR